MDEWHRRVWEIRQTIPICEDCIAIDDHRRDQCGILISPLMVKESCPRAEAMQKLSEEFFGKEESIVNMRPEGADAD
jgi:hypothetical protein